MATMAMASTTLATCTMLRRLTSPHIKRGLRTFATTAARIEGLAGTVRPHWSYLFLHTHDPPSAYASKPKSPLERTLAVRAREWGGLVNFSWSPEQPVADKYDALPGKGAEGEEAYAGTMWAADGRRLDLPEVSLATLDIVCAQMQAHTLGDSGTRSARLQLYVCTHGARDCRCGETGGAVSRALQAEVARRKLGDAVSVACVGHVGGHKYAANVLVFPYGDWLGTVQEVDVPSILDEILERHRTAASHKGERPPLCPPFWRGRIGLDKDQQLALFAKA